MSSPRRASSQQHAAPAPQTATDRPQVALFISASADGFIARKNGSMDWLAAANTEAGLGSQFPGSINQAEDCGWGVFISSCDAIVMGRKSYERIMASSGAWPYPMPVVVMTRIAPDAEVIEEKVAAAEKRAGKLLAEKRTATASATHPALASQCLPGESIEQVISRIHREHVAAALMRGTDVSKVKPFKVYVDGGETIQSALAVPGLVTEITVTTVPRLIGSGIALFGEGGISAEVGKDVQLTLLKSSSWEFGFTQCKYALRW